MKRTAFNHRKVRRLARLLRQRGIGQHAAMLARGMLEGLWYATATNAPHGDIGRIPPDELAEEIDWDGDGDDLIEMLIQAEWLERHPTAGLIVHDWPEHADRLVHRAVLRSLRPFADGTWPNLTHGVEGERSAWIAKFGVQPPDRPNTKNGHTGGYSDGDSADSPNPGESAHKKAVRSRASASASASASAKPLPSLAKPEEEEPPAAPASHSPPWGPLERILALDAVPPSRDPATIGEREAWLTATWPEIAAAAEVEGPDDSKSQRSAREKNIALPRWRVYRQKPERAFRGQPSAEERAAMRAFEAQVAAEDAERAKNPPPPVPFKLKQHVVGAR